jgi:hypothetical protein
MAYEKIVLSETVVARLRDWGKALDKASLASTNASTCRTEYDWRRAHETEAAAETAEEAVEAAIREMVGEAIETATAAARRTVHAGTGAESWCLGWQLRRRYRDDTPATMALGANVLRGYVACAIAQAMGAELNDDAAIAAWSKTP